IQRAEIRRAGWEVAGAVQVVSATDAGDDRGRRYESASDVSARARRLQKSRHRSAARRTRDPAAARIRASEAPGSGALAGLARKSAHLARHRESCMAGIFRTGIG